MNMLGALTDEWTACDSRWAVSAGDGDSQNLEEMPEIKYAVTEIRKVFDWLIHKLDTAEDRLCLHFLKKCQEKLAKLKCKKENIKFKRQNRIPKNCTTIPKRVKYSSWEYRRRRRAETTKEISEATMATNFPKSLMRTYLGSRELRERGGQTPKPDTYTHHIRTLKLQVKVGSLKKP